MQFNFESIKKNLKNIVVAKVMQAGVTMPLTADAPIPKEPFIGKEVTIEQIETLAEKDQEIPALDISKKS